MAALPRGPAGDRAVRMLTEAGATALWPVLAARSQRQGERTERWQRILTEAARQCGRADVPELEPRRPLPDALARLPEGLDRRVAVPGAPPLGPARGPAALLIGPEGGLTAAEVDRAREAGFAAMGLGRWVLRAETAAAVAVAMLAPR